MVSGEPPDRPREVVKLVSGAAALDHRGPGGKHRADQILGGGLSHAAGDADEDRARAMPAPAMGSPDGRANLGGQDETVVQAPDEGRKPGQLWISGTIGTKRRTKRVRRRTVGSELTRMPSVSLPEPSSRQPRHAGPHESG